MMLIMGIWHWTSTRWLFFSIVPRSNDICIIGFCGGRKTGGPGEKTLEQGREPTTNSTHTLFSRSGNQTRTTLVGGDRSRYRTIPVPGTRNFLTFGDSYLSDGLIFQDM